MSRLLAITSAVAGFTVIASSLMLVGEENPRPSGLSGARPVIDACRFPNIQAALDAVPPEGGKVLLPPGLFEIQEPLRIKTGDVCLEGAGAGTHIKNVNTNGQAALVLAHSAHELKGNERGKELWRIRLANLRLTGNEESGPGIAAYNINEIFIDGVTVSEHGKDGIVLNYCYEDPRVCDSLITYNQRTGLNLVGCHDIVVSSNQFEENADAVHCFDGFNLCMTGNCLDDHLGRGVVIENTYGSVVSGNMIEECAGTAIVLDRDCYGITLSANVIAHNGAGVDLPDAHGCTVSANTFTIVKTDAVRIGPGSGRITVTGNSFSDSFIGEGQEKRSPDDRSAAGIVLMDATDVGVSGNVFSGLSMPAIQAQGEATARILFAGNIVTQCESNHDSLQESLVSGNLD